MKKVREKWIYILGECHASIYFTSKQLCDIDIIKEATDNLIHQTDSTCPCLRQKSWLSLLYHTASGKALHFLSRIS
jgi:hypothetical protein